VYALLQDLRHSARMLRKNPVLTITCAITLALGIGLTTMWFSVINGCMYQPLPFEDSDRLMAIGRTNLSQDVDRMGVSIHDFYDWRGRQTSFEDISGFYGGTVNVTREGDPPVRFQGAFIVPSVFNMLGVQPVLGRLFTDEEMKLENPPVILLSYRVWQANFGGDPQIVGTEVRANAEPMTIVGVMPEGFLFPSEEGVWLPLRYQPSQFDRNQGTWMNVVGKLREGVSIEQASAEFDVIAANLAEQYPETNEGIGVRIEAFTDRVVGGQVALILYLFLAGMFAVLLIACFNVANLLLARAAVRAKELAVRTSLGASRRRILGQLLMESFAFSVVGAAVGLLLGHIGITIFDRAAAASDPPWWFDFSIDWTVVGFVAFLAVVSALVSGILPAIQATRAGLAEVLQSESRGASSLKMSRFSRVLVIAQISFSCALLVVAGLTAKSVIKVGSFDFGIESEGVFTARVGLFPSDYPTEESRAAFWQKLHARLESVPGIVAAGLTSNLPLRGSQGGGEFVIEGVEYAPDAELPSTMTKLVTPGYFRALGINLIRGRDIKDADVAGSQPVVVVNQSLVDRHLAGMDPIGKRARPADDDEAPWYTIVGLVADEWTNVENENPELAYASLYQDDARFLNLVIKSAGEPMAITPEVRKAVMEADPNLPIYWVFSMDEIISDATWPYTLFGGVIQIAGIVALFLASVGLYGVMAFSVNRRRREIGIRMALGARPTSLRGQVLRQGAVQLAIGAVIGVVLALLMASGIRILLFGVEPTDPVVMVLILATLGLTGVAACFIPARRATLVDPVTALNTE
jgi:predicted permease